MVKNLPAMRETWVLSLGWEDPLKRTATHSSVLAWRIPWTEEPGVEHNHRVTKSQTQLSMHAHAEAYSTFFDKTNIYN